MQKAQKPSLVTGGVVGLLLTPPLIAVLFLAFQLIGTPFVPFDVFDWVGRVLPGAVITFGIDMIVGVITALKLGETSSAAKMAEHILAVGGLVATGVIAGAVLFALLRRIDNKSRYLPGIITGLVVGLPVMFISTSINKSASASMLVSAVWIVLAFVVWGLALSWVYNRLSASTMPTMTPAVAGASASSSSVQVLDRRRFLITVGGATAAITVLGAGVAAALGNGKGETATTTTTEVKVAGPWSASNKLPNADDPLQPADGTRPEFTALEDHYRIDINSLPPEVREDEWSLAITGLVDKPANLKLSDIRSQFEPTHQFITLACISNPLGGDLTSTQRWTGVSMQKLLASAGLKSNATHLKITAADGFDEFVDLELIKSDPRVMLTYAWDGLPLAVEHGFPTRIYIPSRYGMKQPKWITNIEVVDAWQEGYWVRRGWDKDAIMQTTSVIDTVATNMMIVEADKTKKIPVGGIAHAGARGISKVEVSVDDGPWEAAQLRKPLSETTWVIWRYDWPFAAGSHTFAVRTYAADGTMQITDEQGSRPSGATGIFTKQMMV